MPLSSPQRAGLHNPVEISCPALPLGIGLLALYSGKFRAVLDAVPMAWLAGFHPLRIPFGFVFLSMCEMGRVPAAFAFREGDMETSLPGCCAVWWHTCT